MIYNEQYFKNYMKYNGTVEEIDLMYFRANEILKKAIDLISCRPSTIVDVGCATGVFIKTAKMQMSTADNEFIGIDVNPFCIAYCTKMGHKAFTPEMYEYFYKNKEIDIMTFWDTLEHIQDPRKLLNKHKPKVICISIPCLNGFYEAMPNKDIQLWKHYRPQEHLWNFTIETLTEFLNEIGYDISYLTYEESKFRVDKLLGGKNIMTIIAKKK